MGASPCHTAVKNRPRRDSGTAGKTIEGGVLMARSEAKQSWTSPELIVLVRGTADERVLGACKATPNVGSVAGDTACFESLATCSECANESYS